MLKKMFKVVSPVERNGVTHWTRLGVGFPNKDESINLYLDAFPANGKLQLREYDEADFKGRGAATRPAPAPAAAGDAGDAPADDVGF